ncbi:hypothetical protein [Dethiothermospora halolimnae]|uniref:hypothetical protein n=1 Tax=Dethiothermospora halolimnae TaxID=3114390 RepID=UPI003CCB9614
MNMMYNYGNKINILNYNMICEEIKMQIDNFIDINNEVNKNYIDFSIEPKIKTPVGEILINLYLDNEMFSIKNFNIFKYKSGYLFHCESKMFLVQLLIIEEDKQVTDDIRVDGRYSIKWRIKAYDEIKNLKFETKINEKNRWKDAYSDSGEWMAAKTWDNGERMITIATEDEDSLEGRARNDNWIPIRLKDIFIEPKNGYIIVYTPEYTDDGMIVEFPNLLKDEKVLVEFGVSWYQYKNDNEFEFIKTWYGADPSLL